MKDPIELDIGSPITASPLVADIDDDGANELVVVADRLYCWRLPSLAPLPRYPKRIAGPSASTPVLARTADGTPFMIFGSDDDRLYAVDASGAPMPGFPVATGGDVFTTPLVANLNNSSRSIIFGSDDGGLYAMPLERTAANEEPSMTRFATNGFVSSTPALLPRQSGNYDIVFGSWDGGLYCLRGDDPQNCRWRVDTGHLIWSSPAIADIDGDGSSEIIVANDRLHVVRSDGSVMSPFPFPLGGMAIGAPAIGDLMGNGELAIVVCADRLYAFRADGTQLPGFPVDTGAPFWASPILADVDGDGRDEIIAGDYSGFLHVVTGEAERIAGFPRRLGSSITSSPLAVDLDGDGLLELVACTFDGKVHALPTRGATSQWPNFRGPLSNGIQPQRGSAVESLPARAESFPSESCRISNRRIVRKKFARQILYELHLDIQGSENFQRGVLYFHRNGQWHPSPVLRNGSRLIARFPPFGRLSRVSWYATLDQRDGVKLRLPAHGDHAFRTW